MSQTNHLTEAELRQRLAEVEAILAALRSSKADTLIGNNGPLLFQPKSAVEERERQQRQAERIAREWATTFDAVQDAIWILDLDQRVVRANAAAEKAFGCPLAEMIGRRCFETAHRSDRPIDGCPFCRMRASRRRETFEMQLGERWFEVTTDPLLDANDNLVGAVHIAADITERKRAEEELRRHAEELRIRNEALTRFNAVAVGRELRMIELKREVNELCLKIGEPPRYKIVTVPQTSDTPPEGRK